MTLSEQMEQSGFKAVQPVAQKKAGTLADQMASAGIKPLQQDAQQVPEKYGVLGSAVRGVQSAVDLASEGIRATRIPAVVGGVAGLAGGAIGGLIGGLGETAVQSYRGATGKGFDVKKIGQAAVETAKETAKFGQEIGTEGAVAAPFAGLGRIPSAVIAAPTLYQGVTEKDPTKLAIGALGVVGAKYSKGNFIDPEVRAAAGLVKNKITGGVPTEGLTNKILTQAIDKGIKPGFTGLKTAKARTEYYSRAQEALKTIRDFEPKLADEAGDLVVRAPATRLELLDGLGQAKSSIFKEYDDLAEAAGDIGARFDASPTISRLQSIIPDKKYSPETRSYAAKLAEDLAELQGERPVVIQERIKDLNNSLGAFYDGRITKAKAQIDASAANALREQLDKQIDSLTGANYQALKNQFGSLKAIEKDVARQAAIEARRNPKSLLDMTDLFTGGDLIAGLLTANPALIARGAAARGWKEYIKWLNDPNRSIRNAFEHLYSQAPRWRAPVVKPKISGLLGQGAIPLGPRPDTSGIVKGAPSPQMGAAVSPTELNKIKGIKELPQGTNPSAINQGRSIPVLPPEMDYTGPGIVAGGRKPKVIEGEIVKSKPQKTTPPARVGKVAERKPAKLFHGSEGGALKVDRFGNINLSTSNEVSRFGDLLEISTKNLNVKKIGSKEEMFDIVSNPEKKQKLINEGVDVLSAENHQIALDPKSFSKKIGVPLREKAISEKTIGELQDGLTDPLISEAKKYKSADEFVKANKPATVKIGPKVKKLPIKDLYAHGEPELKDAIKAVENGNLSRTEGPIDVTQLPNGKIVVLDGQHRVVEAAMGGEDSIKVNVVSYEDATNPDFDYGVVRSLIENHKDFEGVPFLTRAQLTDIWNQANKK